MTNKEAPCIFFKVDSLIQLNPNFVTENRNKIIYRLKYVASLTMVLSAWIIYP